jgi:hypothetical protein
MILKIFVIIIVILFLFFVLEKMILKPIEEFNNNVYFLTKDELFVYLSENKDRYYNSFFKNDFKARKIESIEDYINKIQKSVSDFTEYEKNKLQKCISLADNKLLKTNLEWFRGSDTFNIPWKIGAVKGKLYENGLPHTRDDIIIFPKNDVNNSSIKNLMKTLIHEKIHLYQKVYPEKVNDYLRFKNFRKIKMREESDNIRANPDLDGWIYLNSENEKLTAVYNKNPKDISDITYSIPIGQKSEHPFESMAIEIENNKI